MLSYQHIYHAGNPADIQKHLWLITVLNYLLKKDKQLCWIDTHAGRGLYDLNAPEAQKLSEYKNGIKPVYTWLQSQSTLPEPLAIYKDVQASENKDGSSRFYLGSALIAAKIIRETDRLFAFDMHKGEYPHLAQSLTPYQNAKTRQADGLEHLLSLIPPKEKRGGALIDPSYEIKSEYAQVLKIVEAAHKRWPQGVFMIWYPMLPAGYHTVLSEAAAVFGEACVVDEWVYKTPKDSDRGMYGSGMVVVNPPYTTPQTLNGLREQILPLLRQS